jgi:hypothetical protein
MVALAMIVLHKVMDGLAQRTFCEQNYPLQARFLECSDRALGMGIVDCQQLQAVRVNPLVDQDKLRRYALGHED